jgi:hypothetical protein
MELRIRNVGWQTASKMPRRVRTATREGKFQHTACRASVVDQARMLKPRYFAMGTRWRIQFVGYSTMRTAM